MLQKSWVHMHALIEDLESAWVLDSSHVGAGTMGKSSLPSFNKCKCQSVHWVCFIRYLNRCLEAFSIRSYLCAGFLPRVQHTRLACATRANLAVVIGIELKRIVSEIRDNIDQWVTLSHWGADLSNRLPQLKHRRPGLCLPVLEEDESEGNTICLGSLDRKSSGALHPVTWHRHVDTCSSSWSSHTGDTRPGSWVRGSGSWAGQQPRSGSEHNACVNINTGI